MLLQLDDIIHHDYYTVVLFIYFIITYLIFSYIFCHVCSFILGSCVDIFILQNEAFFFKFSLKC